MTWGLNNTLSFRVTVPVRMPLAVGAKVTLITQLDFGATGTVMLQLLVAAGASAKFPLAVIELKTRFVVPVLVTVTDLAALVVPTLSVEKLMAFALSFACGLMIVAVKGTVCGLPGALSVITNSADCGL